MALDYETYEKKCQKNKDANSKHLDNFDKWLQNHGLTKKTIDNHIFNVDFYINDFLCAYDVENVIKGCDKISEFLGDWFIRKAMWSSCANIKSNATSIKKFYSFLLDSGMVKQDDYDMLCETIKDEMPDWLDEMKRYDEMDEDF